MNKALEILGGKKVFPCLCAMIMVGFGFLIKDVLYLIKDIESKSSTIGVEHSTDMWLQALGTLCLIVLGAGVFILQAIKGKSKGENL